jgi:hypothetical protein
MPKKLYVPSRARRIKLILFNLDGVLTNGERFILPFSARNAAQPSARSKEPHYKVRISDKAGG